MSAGLVSCLLPVLVSRSEKQFNVFDVMRHGTHEKQLSNVFAWLLDPDGTHHLGTAFQDIFIDALNRGLGTDDPIPYGPYGVLQEVDTSDVGMGMDIADLVLEDQRTSIVIENYYTSDGHGHSYEGYRQFGARGGKRSVVVMLCGRENMSALVGDWKQAAVVVYSDLVAKIAERLASDDQYRRNYPDQSSFLDQMERRFVKGRRVNDDNLVNFIDVMCRTGEARHFRSSNRADAALRFADRLRDEAKEQFLESRELLARIKHELRAYCESILVPQVNAELDEALLGRVSVEFQGIYEWTVNLRGRGDADSRVLQLKFGPSAWWANEKDKDWERQVPPAEADYSRLFITHQGEIRQTSVSLQEVLDGLSSGDLRLRDEIAGLIQDVR